MAVMEPDRRHSVFSRSMRRSMDAMGFFVFLKAPTETKLPFGSTNSPSANSPSKTDFEPKFVADNSEAATNGVNGNAPGWRRSTIWLLRGSKTRLAKLRPETGMDSSNSESEGGTFGSFNSVSAASSSEAEFETCHESSEESKINETSRIKRDATSRRGFRRSIPIWSSKLSGKGREDGGMESPNSKANSKESGRQDLSSKVDEHSTHAQEEGAKTNLQLVVVQDEEFPTAKDQVEDPEQPDAHERGSNRAMKAYISLHTGLYRSVNHLRISKSGKYRRKVVVNGVPIKDVDVKKAEELAGPIHPGNFWYDIQAGFWGVEPGPCLGIIPPCIFELDTPMSRSCSGGDTGILVNGRELHQKDLKRLSFRGLPTTSGMAYCISIDGRVTEESSRKYVTSLGLLAPSLGRNGRGSGIYMPAAR